MTAPPPVRPLLAPLPAVILAVSVVCQVGAAILQLGVVPIYLWAGFMLAALVISAAGALIVTHRPSNRIGLLFVAWGLFSAATSLAGAYGVRGVPAGFPGAIVGEWIVSWSWAAEFAIWPVAIVLLPDGRLPSQRWTAVIVAALVGAALAVPGYALSPDSASQFVGGRNPFAIASPVVDGMFRVGSVVLLSAMLAAIVSLVLRLRRAGPTERQQLKWVVYAAAIFGALVVSAPFPELWRSIPAVQLAFAIGYTFVPAAIAIAILPHRLFDIDVDDQANAHLLARDRRAGGGLRHARPDAPGAPQRRCRRRVLPVALSTLAIAALFGPVRARVGGIVDRRFYRSRYDAQRTLEQFAGRLRDEVSPDAVGRSLVEAASGAVRPASIGVWIRQR